MEEIKRWDIINRFIKERKYESFLEIGTATGETYKKVIAKVRISVDPELNTNATYKMTSDEYFSNIKHHNNQKFDIIFIDGYHEHNQAFRDILNALDHLNKNGMIIVHDCHPTNESMQNPFMNQFFWTGDVWKAFLKARAVLKYECYILDYDFGCGVIDTTKEKFVQNKDLPTDMEKMTYFDFINHPEWLDFRTW